MSKFFESYDTHRQSVNEAGVQWQALYSECPLLAEAMRGRSGQTAEDTVWPSTLSLFWEGDTLKFCLSPKQGPRVCFGTVSDASGGLSGVEQSLRDGHFEWKKRTRSASH